MAPPPPEARDTAGLAGISVEVSTVLPNSHARSSCPGSPVERSLYGPINTGGTRHNRSVGGSRLGPYIRFETLSLRHQLLATGSQPRFCREKTRGICTV